METIPRHTIMTMRIRAKYQEIQVPKGEACGVKKITGINNYSNQYITSVNRSRPRIKATVRGGVTKIEVEDSIRGIQSVFCATVQNM